MSLDRHLERVRHFASSPAALLSAFGGTLGALGALTLGALGVWSLASWSPVLALWCGALIGIVVGASRWRRLLWACAAVVFMVYVVVAATPLIRGPAHALIRRDLIPPPGAALGAVIVLSGAVSGDGVINPEAVDRLLTGLELAHAGVAPRLVVTHIVRSVGGKLVTSDADQQRLRDLVSGSFTMLVTPRVHTTHDEALRSWELLAPLGVRNVAVVTSPLHTHRACATFERAGFTVTCVPSISRTLAVWRLRPASERVEAFAEWLYETVGWAVYKQRGWV